MKTTMAHLWLRADGRKLGMGRGITRRDFGNPEGLGTGYGGEGGYAKSNGNTWEVAFAGHGTRDTLHEQSIAGAVSTVETYGLIIVGVRFTGAISAYIFLKLDEAAAPLSGLRKPSVIASSRWRMYYTVSPET